MNYGKQLELNNELSTIVIETERQMMFRKLFDRAISKRGRGITPLGSWETSLKKYNGKYWLWYNEGIYTHVERIK